MFSRPLLKRSNNSIQSLPFAHSVGGTVVRGIHSRYVILYAAAIEIDGRGRQDTFDDDTSIESARVAGDDALEEAPALERDAHTSAAPARILDGDRMALSAFILLLCAVV